MLLNGHDLNGCIAKSSNTWQNVHAELLVCSYLFFRGSHTDVALVDEQRIDLRTEQLVAETIRTSWCPHLSRENLGLLILDHTTCIRRDTLTLSAIPVNREFIEFLMMHSIGRKGNLPNTVFNRLTCIFGLLLPIVHLTNDVNGRGIGCPFAEDPCTILLTMKSEVQISVCKIAKRTSLLCRLMNLPGSILEAAKDSIGEIVKIRQVAQHLK